MDQKYIAQDPLDNIFSDSGGIYEGSLIMCSGEPGVGKTTLMLNYLSKINQNYQSKLAYVSSEMSQLDNEHIYKHNEDIRSINTVYVGAECFSELKQTIENNDIIFIDSINSIIEKVAYFSDTSKTKAELNILSLLEQYQGKKIIIFSQKVNKDGLYKGSSLFGHLTTTNIHLKNKGEYREISLSKNRRGSIDKILNFKIEKGEIKYQKERQIDDKLKEIHEKLV